MVCSGSWSSPLRHSFKPPRVHSVPKIGELESWVHDPNDQDWRNTLVQLGARIKNIPYNERPRNPITNAGSGGNIRWVGEVVNVSRLSTLG